ncbi:hypothetical protein SDC9_179419 [bioreactor metagenome]|uniref:Uncharacterized protein n=1 Tax=bioreactor metagenome TaxID=1076179 RepID=A0A645H6P6_9ZZZZ
MFCVGDKLTDSFLPRKSRGKLCLPADFCLPFGQRNRKAPFGKTGGACDAGGTRADHKDAFFYLCPDGQAGKPRKPGIEDAMGLHPPKDPCDASLVAGDAGVDGLPRNKLVYVFGIGKQGPSHIDEIAVTRL